MNKARKEKVKKIVDMLETAKSSLEDILDEEQTAYDNMPEGLQMSERGQVMEEAITDFEDAGQQMDDLIDLLDELTR